MPEHPEYTNRLIRQKSPYLLQHAHNPVDWYPWGEEAFQQAKETNKPIFLSIGYATCHWCHIMEKESFEDVEIASLLNATFVNIKVDREELPEVDSLYMEFAQSMMSGAAGWPLNVLLTPDLQPFFAATYLPPREQNDMMGLKDLILRIQEVWSSDEKERVLAQAEKIVEVFEDSIHVRGESIPPKEMIEAAIEVLYHIADPVYGGMKGAPKFPIGYQTNLLLNYSSIANESRALFMAERTLDMMQRGGIYDHLGGGFSRYTVDEKWIVPHFEKMLYDNALLSSTYLEAWKLTKRDLYRQISEEIIHYVMNEMTHPDGGFYSAQDADSEGKEGLFYTWTPEEIKEILGEDDGKIFCSFFDVSEEGNFEGRNVLNTPKRLEEFAVYKGLEPLDFEKKISKMKHRVWSARQKRVAPLIDDKILSSWNGLMIYSAVEAGAAYNELSYIQMGARSAQFIRDHLWKDGHLLRRWREEEALYNGGLDEYAFLIKGLLSLFESGCGNNWLIWAMEMIDILEKSYKVENGGFYQTDGSDPFLILRKCQFTDGAEPSGNAAHCENLLRMYQLTYDKKYLKQAEDIFSAVKQYLEAYPSGYSYHVLNLTRYYSSQTPTIVIALSESDDFQSQIQEIIFSSFLPHRGVIWRKYDDQQLFSLIPWVKDYVPINGNTTVYLCHEGVCKKPLTKLKDIKEAFEKR